MRATEHTCEDCGRRGTRGFWQSRDVPDLIDGWRCTAVVECARRERRRKEASRGRAVGSMGLSGNLHVDNR